jgi:hypothetical protein
MEGKELEGNPARLAENLGTLQKLGVNGFKFMEDNNNKFLFTRP